MANLYNQDGVLDKVFNTIGERAAFFSKLIKSSKIIPEYNKIRSEFVKNKEQEIKDYVLQRINAYRRLAGERQIRPHNLLALVGAIDALRRFEPVVAIIRTPMTNNLEFVKFLLSYNMKHLDPKEIVALGLPISYLNKIVKELSVIKNPEEKLELFKTLLADGAVKFNKKGIEPRPIVEPVSSDRLYNE